MKVILQQDIRGKGKRGQMIEVSDGYARNYMLPRKLAVEATADNVNTMRMNDKAMQEKRQREREEASAIAARMRDLTVTVFAKGGGAGRLFGSVTTQEIADALKQSCGIELDRRKLVLDEPITNLDAKLREEMILEIQMIQQNIGTTIIYITHDQEAALQLCDRIAIMQPDGQICQIGSDEEIIRRPANRFVYSFIGVSNFLPVTEKGGKVCLALGGEPVLFDAPPQGYVSGKKNVMGVRPMDIVFDAKSPIRATIQRDTFLGNQYDYQVELMGKELRVERNALDVLADPTRYEAGQEVGLKFLNVKFYEEGAKA